MPDDGRTAASGPAGPAAAEPRSAILGLDTATAFLSLALVDGTGVVLASAAPRVERDHAARVIPALRELFVAAGTTAGAVRGVVVGVGPGSYTGLRVGIATAQGLARGWGVAVAGSDTLGAIADAGLGPGETGIAAIDARRGNVYWALYQRGAGGAEPLTAPAKGARDEVRSRHPGLRMIEGIAPSATWHTRRFGDALPPAAVYL